MRRHHWEQEYVDGGTVDGTFWKCAECGASGGPVWPASAGGVMPPRNPFRAGTGIHLSLDCDEAEFQVRRAAERRLIPHDRILHMPVPDPFAATARRIVRNMADAGYTVAIDLGQGPGISPWRSGEMRVNGRWLPVRGSVDVLLGDGHVCIGGGAPIPVRKLRRRGEHAPGEFAARILDAVETRRRHTTQIKVAADAYAVANSARLAHVDRVRRDAPCLLREAAALIRESCVPCGPWYGSATALLARINALTEEP